MGKGDNTIRPYFRNKFLPFPGYRTTTPAFMAMENKTSFRVADYTTGDIFGSNKENTLPPSRKMREGGPGVFFI